MKPSFELKYLQLNWYDEDTLISITESLVALDVEYDNDLSIFSAETTIYPKIECVHKGVLAVRFFNANTDSPYIEMPNGSKNFLSAITDTNTGITWWIVKDEWISETKQWTGIAPNVVGKIRFILQGTVCEVAINGIDFSLTSLEEYLRTFKDDLWELILDDNSTAQLAVKPGKPSAINEHILECIEHLTNHAQKILENPKVELREIQTLKPRKSVKPVNRTFMELATKANQRLLTSRGTQASYNVAENRYILFAIERCLRIVTQLAIVTKNKSQRYQQMTKNLQTQYDSFREEIIVDRTMVVEEWKRLKKEKELSYWSDQFHKKLDTYPINYQTSRSDKELYLKIGKQAQGKNGFFVNYWNGQQWGKFNQKTTILSLNNFKDLLCVLEHGMTIKLLGTLNVLNQTAITTGNEFYVFYLNSLSNIELLNTTQRDNAEKAFNALQEEAIKLKQNNWIKVLSRPEKEEQEREKTALQNRILFYQKNQNTCQHFYQKIKPKLQQLKKIARQLNTLGVRASSHFPNSMTFVQNPHYQNVHNNYKIIREATNLQDEYLLESLEEVDNIGIINMPLLYERLVLMQLIAILKDNFHFVPQHDWKYKLIQAIKSNDKNIEIQLANQAAKRYITLTYEKELPNGKRPDFTIDLTWFKENDSKNEEAYNQRFILDAKFYDKSTFQRAGGMEAKINELYEIKNYSEGGKNPVFLIHPCNNLIEKRISAQAWGKYSYLGELYTEPAHHKGAVFFSPVDKIVYRDELQRLLGMFLQYLLEPSDIQSQSNDRTLAVPICIRCGSSNYQIIHKTKEYRDSNGNWKQRTPKSVWQKCIECEQWQVYNHCANDKQRLIKNGFYWSYHAARAIEPFNIKCPHCSSWGFW